MRRLLAALIVLAQWPAAAAAQDAYADRFLPAAGEARGLRVTFVGVATLLFDDGETAIMTDGFFTRPSARDAVQPDPAIVADALQRLGVRSLAAVIVMHSHFDHALDSPVVARRTGALLVGSSSTANVGRGQGFAEDRMRLARDGETLAFGRFKVTFVVTAHLPSGFAAGEITSPLALPAPTSAFQMGDCYTVFVEHGGRTLLVQGSAGFKPGALAGRKADVAYVGVGGLGVRDESYKDDYWRETVELTGARRVIPIHWDNFRKPLSEVQPQAGFDKVMEHLMRKAGATGVELRVSPIWRSVDPFADLPAARP